MEHVADLAGDISGGWFGCWHGFSSVQMNESGGADRLRLIGAAVKGISPETIRLKPYPDTNLEWLQQRALRRNGTKYSSPIRTARLKPRPPQDADPSFAHAEGLFADLNALS
jgi:hypothetical protein